MISKAKKGRSFKGAALYFLHDKNSLTSERVDFTHTGNLATNDPDMAARMMAYTAMHQDEIKRAAGGVLKGRKNTYPVYAYSISWHPSQEPTQEQIIEAGYESLKAVGLNDHEFIMVSHNDEPHKHLHIIVNRVHPETGKAAKLSNDYRHLSEWAEEYERTHGKIFCKQRVENNKQRQNGEYVKDRQSQNKAEFHRWRREKVRQAFGQRQNDEKTLSAIHKNQRDELFKARERQLEETRRKLKEANRPKWAVIYRQQKGERLELQEAKRSAMGRLVYYIKNRNQNRPTGTLTIRSGLLSGAFNAITNGNDLSKTLDENHKQQRKAFSLLVERNNRGTIEEVKKDYLNEFTRLQNIQRGERDIQKTRHIDESKKLAADLTSGKTEKDFERQNRDHEESIKRDFNIVSGRTEKDIKSLRLKEDFGIASARMEKDMKGDKLKEDFGIASGKTQKDITPSKLKEDFSLKEDFNIASGKTQKDTERKKKNGDMRQLHADLTKDKGREKSKEAELKKEFNIASGKTPEDAERKKKDEDMRQLRADLTKNTGRPKLKEGDLKKDFGIAGDKTEKGTDHKKKGEDMRQLHDDLTKDKEREKSKEEELKKTQQRSKDRGRGSP